MNNSCYYKYENIINMLSRFIFFILYQPCKRAGGYSPKICQQGITRKAHEPQNSACSEIRGQRYCEKIKAI